MRPSSGDPVDDLEELRRLLISREQEELRELRASLADKEKRAQDVAGVLPQAVKLSRERSSELTAALLPAVESSVRDSIENRPQIFIDALHPIIGSVVRRSLAESLRGLIQSLNQTLEHTFSWRGLKWRFEALRTGRTFAEVVMLRSLVYRVEQLFLIHRETSLSLLHVSAAGADAQDPDMVAGMLSAIQDFTRDSFKTGQEATLEEFRVGELQVWIAPGRHAYLAAVIRGNPPRELRTSLEETIESVHILRASTLADFKGDAAPFGSLRPELEACLRAQYETAKTSKGRKSRVWFLFAAVAGSILATGIVGLRREQQWDGFVARLHAQPGIVVTEAERGWFSKSRVAGLRDPLAAEPAAIAREARVNPDGVRFDWKDYHALDPSLILQRFETAFPKPPTVSAKMDRGTLILAGSAPYEWLMPVRAGAAKIPGISAVADAQLQVAYPPQPVLQRFTDRFGLPDGLNANVKGDVVVLSGEATHAWIARVRNGAKEVPGIKEVDDRKVIDLDGQTFQQTKSVIESAFIYFLADKDNFATEGFAALSRLPDEIRRCFTAAKRLGLEPMIEIHGHADAVGTEVKNADLSARRAAAVQTFLVACGFDRETFRPVALGATAQAGTPMPEQSDRRVSFRVMTKPVPAAP